MTYRTFLFIFALTLVTGLYTGWCLGEYSEQHRRREAQELFQRAAQVAETCLRLKQ